MTPESGSSGVHSDPAQRVRTAARNLGFDAVAIARADVALDREIERYDRFIAAGMHGDMKYLERNRRARARLDAEGVLEGAKSVVCVARRYPRFPQEQEPRTGIVPLIARYARGRDYHGFLRRRLRRLAAFVRALGSADTPVRARPLCDDEPILERAWAARAGLGFVGKNGLIIVPGIGSMVLLGEVVTTLELPPDTPVAERCGACTRCLSACPTQAFVAPFVLDARRCVSYLTIEHRGAFAVELRESVGTHLFGCDDCQTVCPFNAGQGARSDTSKDDGEPFEPLERWSTASLEELLALDSESYSAMSRGSPVKRSGKSGLARNAAIALGNRGDPSSLETLRTAATQHEDPTVRDAAAWAVARLTR